MTQPEPLSVTRAKQDLRARMKRLTLAHKKNFRDDSPAIFSRLVAQDWWAGAFQVGLYLSTPSEISTESIQWDLLGRGMRFAVPVWKADSYVWSWVEAERGGAEKKAAASAWRIGRFGLPEPRRFLPVAGNELRVILVPGLAFDGAGNRLGRGGGYFDRLLAASPDAFRIALALESQILEHVPTAPHDVPMDAILTEKGFRFMKAAESKMERLVTGGRCV